MLHRPSAAGTTRSDNAGGIGGTDRRQGASARYYLRLVGNRGNEISADLSVAGKFAVARAGPVPLRKWTHIAATYDGREARIYLDGVFVPSVRDSRYTGAMRAEGGPFVSAAATRGSPSNWRSPVSSARCGCGTRCWRRTPFGTKPAFRLLPNTESGLVGSWSFQSVVNGLVPDLTGGSHNFNAESLERVPVTAGPLARPVWRYGGVNLLRTVTIARVGP